MMAAYVKSLDSNHLLTIGEEGFYGTQNKPKSDYANPKMVDTWAANQGQDFLLNHLAPVGFPSFHTLFNFQKSPGTLLSVEL